MTTRTWISLLGICLAISVIAGIAEGKINPTWTSRLYLPDFSQNTNRHTPLQTQGQYLPPVINKDTTVSPENGPIILKSITHVNPGTTLTLAPGTVIYAHEYAGITVAGTLNAVGTESKPITLISNEAHLLNKVWAGIT